MSQKLTQVWRLQTTTDGGKIADLCLERNILAMGWSMNDRQLADSKLRLEKDSIEAVQRARTSICAFEDYENVALNVFKDINNVRRMREIKPNDLVWIRSKGLYYLGLVTEASKWRYDGSDYALEHDIANQIDQIEWFQVGDESDVPGAISTSLIRGATLQRIQKDGALEYSQIQFNHLKGDCVYQDIRIKDNESNFYSLLTTDDCEDLLCMWLYCMFGYICIPSTNKKATQLYECVLVDPRTGRRVYPQVKDGKEGLNASEYAHLDGDVWLLTTKGAKPKVNQANIHVADPNVLYEFVKTESAVNVLPASIIKWRGFLS